jgi:predicted kinase
MANLIIVRGLPGSGKSTVARALSGYTLIEADMYHTHSVSNQYDFQLDRRPAARAWTDETVGNLLASGQDVVLCGVFATNDLMLKFKWLAECGNHRFSVIHMEANHGNVHDVPQFVLDDMAAQWEPLDLTGWDSVEMTDYPPFW